MQNKFLIKRPLKIKQTKEQELYQKYYSEEMEKISNSFEKNGEKLSGMYARWADEDAYHYATYMVDQEKKKKTKEIEK